MAENVKGLTGEVAPALKKGEMEKGTLTRITTGVASEFMTPEQVENRRVLASAPFAEIEIAVGETGTLITKTFPLYSGKIPPNSIHGKLLAMYTELKVDGNVNLVTKEVDGRNGVFVVWDVVV